MNHPTLASAGDFGGLVLILGAFTDILPPLAALVAMVWYAIEIWESKTVGRLIGRKGEKE